MYFLNTFLDSYVIDFGICKGCQVDNRYPALCSADVALAEVEKEKRTSFIKAWEENKKTKAENK